MLGILRNPKFYLFAAIYVSILFVAAIWVRSSVNLKNLMAEFHKKHPVILSSDASTLITEDNYESFMTSAEVPTKSEVSDANNVSDLTPLVLDDEPPTTDEIQALLAREAAESGSRRAQIEATYAECLKLQDEYRLLKEEEKVLLSAYKSSLTSDELIFGGLSGGQLKYVQLIHAGKVDEARAFADTPAFLEK